MSNGNYNIIHKPKNIISGRWDRLFVACVRIPICIPLHAWWREWNGWWRTTGSTRIHQSLHIQSSFDIGFCGLRISVSRLLESYWCLLYFRYITNITLLLNYQSYSIAYDILLQLYTVLISSTRKQSYTAIDLPILRHAITIPFILWDKFAWRCFSWKETIYDWNSFPKLLPYLHVGH